MKQIYYTSCLAGRSLSGNGGYQIRALSADLAPDLARTFVPALAFELPWNDSDFLAEQAEGKKNPIRLAYLNDPDHGSFVVHSVDAGPDPATDRPGNFFSHLICELPANIDPLQIVGLWKDPFWKVCDDDFKTPLDPLESLPCGSFLSDERFAHFLQNEKNANFFLFLMNAWIRRSEEGRIYLAAPPDTIAFALWGMLRFLHPCFRGDLTFSTYEMNPSRTSAKIVGLWLPGNGSRILPQYCKMEPSLFYNFYRESGSDLSPSDYLHFILQKCRGSRFSDIVRFHDWIDREGDPDLSLMDLLAKTLDLPERLDRLDIQNILKNRSLKPLLLKRLENPKIASVLKRFPEIDALLNPKPNPNPIPPVIDENLFEGIAPEKIPFSKFESFHSSASPFGFSESPSDASEEIVIEEDPSEERDFSPLRSGSPHLNESDEVDENTFRGFVVRSFEGIQWWMDQGWFRLLIWIIVFALLGGVLWYFLPYLQTLYKDLSLLR